MSSTEGVIFGFFAFAEAGDASKLTKSREFVSSSSEHFVGVALMGYVPDDLVDGHVEYVV
jgi:hypothetical protein